MTPSAEATPPPRVLVIDDEPQIRKFVDISLRSQGYATLLAETGQQGAAHGMRIDQRDGDIEHLEHRSARCGGSLGELLVRGISHGFSAEVERHPVSRHARQAVVNSCGRRAKNASSRALHRRRLQPAARSVTNFRPTPGSVMM